jgi:hypothetical protein
MVDIADTDIVRDCGHTNNLNALRGVESPTNPDGNNIVDSGAIPGNSKAFKAWWAQRSAAETVSPELHIAAGRAFVTLQSIEMNREPFKSRAATELSSDALDNFARLWAEHTSKEE